VLAKILTFPNIVCKHHILNSWGKVIRLNGRRNGNQFGKFSSNFDLKNMISTYTMDLQWEMAQIRQISKEKTSKFTRFL
jgi:hypothetical protein